MHPALTWRLPVVLSLTGSSSASTWALPTRFERVPELARALQDGQLHSAANDLSSRLAFEKHAEQ